MRALPVSFLFVASLFAAYPPQDPASSLDALLHDIWSQGVDKAYGLYMGKTVVPMDAAARVDFPRKMLYLAGNPEVGAIILQKSKMEVYPKNRLPEPEKFDGAYFVHFLRNGFHGDRIKERI